MSDLSTISNTLVLLLSAATFTCLAVYDAAYRRLPNSAVGSAAVLFFVYFFVGPPEIADLPAHLLVAAVFLALGSFMFAAHWMGGGDVKMLTVLMLWAGPDLAFPTILLVTFFGALLGIAGLLIKIAGKYHNQRIEHPILRAFSSDRGVPYGIALSVGGLFVLTKHFQRISQSL